MNNYSQIKKLLFFACIGTVFLSSCVTKEQNKEEDSDQTEIQDSSSRNGSINKIFIDVPDFEFIRPVNTEDFKDAEGTKDHDELTTIKPTISFEITSPIVDGPAVSGNGSSTQLPIPQINKELEKYFTDIDEIAKVAQNYYIENFSRTRLITKNGMFYNKASETIINVRYLVEYEGLGSKYLSTETQIMLLDSDDLKFIPGLSLENDDSGLNVYVVKKHPEQNVYLITSSNSRGGVITYDQYNTLLSQYSQSNGVIRRLYADSSEYDRILSFINMYEGKYNSYSVRSIVMDDKYAFVTLSSKGSEANVKQYILAQNNGLWEVVMNGIESEPRVAIAVNRKLPDFNLNIIPAYTVYDYKSAIKTNFNDVLHIMISEGYMSNIDDVQYIAGTNEYTYIILNNELKFLCRFKNSTWEITKMTSYDETYSTMVGINKSAPTFIILDK